MIQFPTNEDIKIETCPLKNAVNHKNVTLGQRHMIKDNPVTCVDIDNENGKYIFSFDDCFILAPHDKIKDILQGVYQTGRIDGIEIFPMNVLEDIDFLFVPSEYQVFGKNYYSSKEQDDDHQFEWYKRGDLTRIKGWRGNGDKEKGDTCSWWLSTVSSGDSTICCYVSSCGIAIDSYASISFGVPIFFQMTKDV